MTVYSDDQHSKYSVLSNTPYRPPRRTPTLLTLPKPTLVSLSKETLVDRDNGTGPNQGDNSGTDRGTEVRLTETFPSGPPSIQRPYVAPFVVSEGRRVTTG